MKAKQREYTVIVGDLIRSRRDSDRKRLARAVPLALSQANRVFSDEFYAPLVQTQGIDTISGVLKRPGTSYKICRSVNERILPNAFRFAVACGRLDVGLGSRDAAKIDGPAFHVAADLVERAKQQNLYYAFALGEESGELETLLTVLASVIHIARGTWTTRQRRVVKLYEELGTQKAVARKLGITQQAVSDALVKSSHKELVRAEEVVTLVLGRARNK
jgi:hypothetical protein